MKAPLRTALLLAAVLACAEAGAQPRGDGPPFLQALHALELDEAQRESVRALLDAQRDEVEALHRRLRAARDALDALDPRAGDYPERARAPIDEAVAAHRARLEQELRLRGEIAALLSDAQLQEWIATSKKRPRPEGRDERRVSEPRN